ncbi:hypothetical protein B4119_1644 [Parageobacillus caldoxylosilyticus]|uniref:Uncharacterized protein n=1 Tax=Saccharococcus caldoxylosilyticus TaxID=81408 RepID=A0A150LN06_9BACL|nr:hypothetical protein B4119_1644 [Parageobacillus caldoxylosilyticus]
MFIFVFFAAGKRNPLSPLVIIKKKQASRLLLSMFMQEFVQFSQKHLPLSRCPRL